eukprot:12812424-Prorocentrum_lima.AAC.1
MARLQAAHIRVQGGGEAQFCPEATPFCTPEGLPLRSVQERRHRHNSCLYTAFATFLGFHGEKNPISK